LKKSNDEIKPKGKNIRQAEPSSATKNLTAEEVLKFMS